jgi:hypothetical protein
MTMTRLVANPRRYSLVNRGLYLLLVVAAALCLGQHDGSAQQQSQQTGTPTWCASRLN